MFGNIFSDIEFESSYIGLQLEFITEAGFYREFYTPPKKTNRAVTVIDYTDINKLKIYVK